MGKLVRWLLVRLAVVALLTPIAVQALDFDREIRRHERMVKVHYRQPPKTLAAFLRLYQVCRSEYGAQRTKCNVAEAKRRYEAYRLAWMEKERARVASVQSGEMNVSLAPKEKPTDPLLQ